MREDLLQQLVANSEGEVYELSHFAPAGMKSGHFFCLGKKELEKIHVDSELFVLPDRAPVAWDSEAERFVTLEKDPFTNEKIYPVAVFLAPGRTVTYNAAFLERSSTEGGRQRLPLFSYAPAVLASGEIHSSFVTTDSSPRHELAGMDTKKIREKTKAYKALFPDNELVRHLEHCALGYGCPAAKNFFLERFEAPLPISPFCNISCIGCISFQEEISCCQERIDFVPRVEDIGEAAVHHLERVPDGVVSFGQGCEGEPLMVPDVLKGAVKFIRERVSKGMVNLNTNATDPEILSELFDLGLDSIRVTLNSFQPELYGRYIRTRKYELKTVLDSIRTFHGKGGFVSVNYLVFPGLTDWVLEKEKFFEFIDEGVVDMIQWRNLNIDPHYYRKELAFEVPKADLVGVKAVFEEVKETYPGVLHGYFNPTRKRIEKFKKKKGGTC